MKIAFVAEPYEEKEASGMGYVILEFMRLLAHILPREHMFVVYSSRTVGKQFLGERENRMMPKGYLQKLWFFYTLKEDFDMVIFMAPMLPLVLPKRIKAVMLCQELGSQKIKPGSSEALFAYIRDQVLMPLSVKRAVRIVVPSQATKDDLVKFYTIPQEKVAVIFNGSQDLSPYAASAPEVEESKKPYFFFTGKVKYRKNVHGIVSAFITFKERTHANAKLVIGGSFGGEYYHKMLSELKEHNLEHDVFFVGYVSIGEQYAFYKHALALVFPSFNEGFGMPIIEAMGLGVPVITSNISSTKEIAADAGLLVDPYDTNSISIAMERVYSDHALRDQLIEKGYARAKQFSWPKAGEELIELLKHL